MIRNLSCAASRRSLRNRLSAVVMLGGLGLFAIGGGLLLSGCKQGGGGGAANANVIKIGEFGSITGSEASFGISTRDGIDLAIDQINAAGGITGKKLQVIVYDNQGKQQEAATTVTKLVTQDNVIAILGEVASARSMAGATIAQQYKIPMISPASTNPQVTEKGDYIFRVCFIDPFQGSAMASFAWNTSKVKKVAIFRDQKNAYSVGLADYFKKKFTELGGTIVADQSYSTGDSDFKSQLTSLRASEPEALFIPGYYTEVGLIAKQARGLGIKAVLLGGDGWDSEEIIKIGGKDIENSFFSSHYSPDDARPEVKKFIEAFKAKFKGVVPDSNAALGYDSAMLLADAMKRAKSLAPTDIRDAIAATKDFPGVTGKITIDAQRNAKKPAVVLEIKNGKYNFVENVAP